VKWHSSDATPTTLGREIKHFDLHTGNSLDCMDALEDRGSFVENEICSKIDSSNLLVAYLDTPTSYGSIAEITYAATKGVPVYVILCYQDKKWEKQFRDAMIDTYWVACNMPGVDVQTITSIRDDSNYLNDHIDLEVPPDLSTTDKLRIASVYIKSAVRSHLPIVEAVGLFNYKNMKSIPFNDESDRIILHTKNLEIR
jgi:hypothetical protein